MELTRTDAVFRRISMMLFYVQKTNILGMTWNSTGGLRKNNKKSSPNMKTRGPTPFSRGWPPLGRAPYLVGPLDALRRQLQLYIFAFGEKKIREKKSSRFMIRSRRQALKPLGRADLSPFGAPERGIHCRRRQPSSITNFMMLTAVRE